MLASLSPDEAIVFSGKINQSVAHVYLKLPLPATEQLEFTGEVEGPFSEFGRTLPARTALRNLGPGESFLAEAVVPDPCPWTPLHPTEYVMRFRLSDGSSELADEIRFGIRTFGVSGRSFYLEAKRWVMRGVSREQWSPEELRNLREQNGSLVVTAPLDDSLGEAVRLGIPTLIRCQPGSLAELAPFFRATCRYPNVVAATFPAEFELPDAARQQSPNLTLLAETDRLSEACPAWASGWVLTSVTSLENFAASSLDMPVVVADWNRQSDINEHRKACDLLQRQVTQFGDFAGYLV